MDLQSWTLTEEENDSDLREKVILVHPPLQEISFAILWVDQTLAQYRLTRRGPNFFLFPFPENNNVTPSAST